MADKKHIGRNGAGSAPFCNGGSTRLLRVGISIIDFKRAPKALRCARCVAVASAKGLLSSSKAASKAAR
jgi:hypothetical protein